MASEQISFSAGQSIIRQGDIDTVAYLINSGRVLIHQEKGDGTTFETELGPGEMVGEMALTGMVTLRTASAIAITDVTAEMIDRNGLLDLLNGPASRITPLLLALFARLDHGTDESCKSSEGPDIENAFAVMVGLNRLSKQVLRYQPAAITQLPWSFSTTIAPKDVMGLLRDHKESDFDHAVKWLGDQHIRLEAGDEHGMILRLADISDYCEVDEKRVGFADVCNGITLDKGYHRITFGEVDDPYQFGIEVLT